MVTEDHETDTKHQWHGPSAARGIGSAHARPGMVGLGSFAHRDRRAAGAGDDLFLPGGTRPLLRSGLRDQDEMVRNKAATAGFTTVVFCEA